MTDMQSMRWHAPRPSSCTCLDSPVSICSCQIATKGVPQLCDIYRSNTKKLYSLHTVHTILSPNIIIEVMKIIHTHTCKMKHNYMSLTKEQINDNCMCFVSDTIKLHYSHRPKCFNCDSLSSSSANASDN